MRLKIVLPLFCISLVSGPVEIHVTSPPCAHRHGSAAFTSEDDQTEAPLGVPQGAPSQQDLLVVQAVGLSVGGQVPLELVQAVVGGLTLDFACQRSFASTSKHLEVKPGATSCVLSPLNSARTSVRSPISPVTVRACFTFRLVSLERNT